MNRRLTHDQRSGLAVTGFLLLALSVALGIATYRLFGMPNLPLKQPEFFWLGGTLICGIAGLVTLYRATEV